jgi:cell wall-associated protease
MKNITKKIFINLIFLINMNAVAASYVVEFKTIAAVTKFKQTNSDTIQIHPFPNESEYFSRLISMNWDGSKAELEQKLGSDNIVQIEASFNLSPYSIIADESTPKVTNDSFVKYQWALKNQGQMVLRETDDIHVNQVLGLSGNDIQFDKIVNFSSTENKTIVAVLDTGVDVNHPELSYAIEKNEIECLSTDKTKDLDLNGYPGDCDGWNFTANLNSEDARSLKDFGGHGTHLSGIIAAKINDEGIAGVTNNLKILPVKVIEDVIRESDRDKLAMSDRLALGILYAIKRGAKVINMSLGWPRSLETKYLRESILTALNRGIIIVAAAGNNSSPEPVSPCGYEGVICVGAQAIDGVIANFSNFGSHVDLLAPGEAILSTIPIDVMPMIFPVQGYEYKNGTSQAAPYISALVGVMKNHFPNLSIDGVMSRLIANSFKVEGNKYTRDGFVKAENLLEPVTKVIIRPQFKLLKQLIYSRSKKQGSFVLPIKNYGEVAQNITVTLKTDSKAIKILNPVEVVSEMKVFESKPINFNYEIMDEFAESNQTLIVEINVNEIGESFKTEVPLLRDIKNDTTTLQKQVIVKTKDLDLGFSREGKFLGLLNTVPSNSIDDGALYYLKKKSTMALDVILFVENETNVEERKLIHIEGAKDLIGALRFDANFDGKIDLMLAVLFEKELRLNFYNDEFEPLFNEYSSWAFTPEVANINFQELRFFKSTHKLLGNVAIPVFKNKGLISKADQINSSFEKPNTMSDDRLYYFDLAIENKSVQLITRTFNNDKFSRETKKTFKLNHKDNIDLITLLPQTNSDFEAGIVKALFSIGLGMKRNLYTLSLNADLKASWSEAVKNLRLETAKTKLGYSVIPQVSSSGHLSFFDKIDANRASLIMYNSASEKFESSVKLKLDIKDELLNLSQSFILENFNDYIVQTKNKLLWVRESFGNVEIAQKDLMRFSFLPGKMLSELYYPLLLSTAEGYEAGVYVDTTNITGNRISILQNKNNVVFSKTVNNLLIPTNCRPMNPGFVPSLKKSRIKLLCQDKLEMNLTSIWLE